MSTYVPKPDLEGINAHPGRQPWLDLVVLLGGFIVLIGVIFFALGFVGEWVFTRMSLETQMTLFKKIGLSSHFDGNKNTELQSLVNKLQPHVPFQLNVHIICEDNPNALALPGGVILLTSGLFKTLQTENGLAFILGHEIGHFINRDHMRGFVRNLTLQLFGSFLGLSMSEQTGTKLILDLSSKSFSRTDEKKADEYSLVLMQKIYGHTFGSEEFFDAMRAKEGTFESLSALASTHPLSSDRYEKVMKLQGLQKLEVPLLKADIKNWLTQTNCPL